MNWVLPASPEVDVYCCSVISSQEMTDRNFLSEIQSIICIFNHSGAPYSLIFPSGIHSKVTKQFLLDWGTSSIISFLASPAVSVVQLHTRSVLVSEVRQLCAAYPCQLG